MITYAPSPRPTYLAVIILTLDGPGHEKTPTYVCILRVSANHDHARGTYITFQSGDRSRVDKMILYCCSARQHICMYGSFIISLPPPAPLSIYLVKSFSFFSTGYIGLIFLSFSPSPSLAYSSWIDGFAAIARVLYSLPDFCVGNGRACNIVHRFGPWLSSAAQYSRMCGDRKSPVLIYIRSSSQESSFCS